ncbi:hypothetical protein J3458_004442 [Metarhizium acridum]|uniref:uncharacterized protein n=1 Tax=Metarhizium acridum TaxID=92637 RepID=UPI001C6CB44F|nr:hypothetical protein J3458_004442 [Metarhizium acridum]
MDLVIDHANTILCTIAPTDISTIITITNTGSPTMTSLQNGIPAKPTGTGKLPSSNTVTIQGFRGQSSQSSDIRNSDSRPTAPGASGPGHGKTGHAAAHTDNPSASSRPGSSNSKPPSNSASSTCTIPVSPGPEESSPSGNPLTSSSACSSSIANVSCGAAGPEHTSSQSAASLGESSAVEGSQTAGSQAESSAELSFQLGALPTKVSQTGTLSSERSPMATSRSTRQSINIQTEASADTTPEEASRTETPPVDEPTYESITNRNLADGDLAVLSGGDL